MESGVKVLGCLPQPDPARPQVVAFRPGHRSGAGGVGVDEPVQRDDVGVQGVEFGAAGGDRGDGSGLPPVGP
jgi:hypothetical protein